MTKEGKDVLKQIGIGVVLPILVLILTALIKGEELAGLSKAAALFHLLRVGVPLWLFLILLVVAALASAHWVRALLLRKETLQVAWQPERCIWGTGSAGTTPLMQVIASGYFSNVTPAHRLIITSVYLEGTKPLVGMYEPVEIEAATCSEKRINAYVEPIIGKKGKAYKGKLILVDQFGIKHKVPIELKSIVPNDREKPRAPQEAEKPIASAGS